MPAYVGNTCGFLSIPVATVQALQRTSATLFFTVTIFIFKNPNFDIKIAKEKNTLKSVSTRHNWAKSVVAVHITIVVVKAE